MSRNDILRQKAAAIDLDEDSAGQPKATASAAPRTAPGQLMGLQGDYRRAQAKITELEHQLDAAGTREIPLSEIYTVDERKRILTDEERAELKANLAQHDLIHPITVLPRNERGYELVAGHNRFEVYRELGKTHIKAVVQELAPDKIELYAFYSNLLSPALSDYEKYLGFKKRKEESGLSQQDLAREAGVSPSTVSMLFRFGELPAEALDLLKQKPGMLGRSAVAELADAVAAGRDARVVEAIRQLLSNPRFTQGQAVAYANKSELERPAKAASAVIKTGRSKFCQVDVRNNVVAIKFADASAAAEWSRKLEEFMRNELSQKN
jgi:ParB family chromosome partitioning protein